MIRRSAESRWDAHLPLQSMCCELPTVPSNTLSRFSAGSGTIANELLGSIGPLRCQLLGIGPVSLPFSPVMPATRVPYWSEATLLAPAPPKIFPATYADGSPLISGLFVVKWMGCACALRFRFP